MKAVVLRRFGGPEVLEYIDWPDPELGPHDVLVRVHAVSVGRTLDVEVRERGADFHVTLPRILGSDPAGVVVATGSEVTDFKEGDRVVSTSNLFCGECEMCRSGREHACFEHGALGVHRDGGYAEYCAVPDQAVVKIPDRVSFEQAAAMGVSYTVSWNLLRYAGQLQVGQDVLVMGAAGGVGIAAIQIAHALGARPIAAAGSGWKLDRLRELLGVEATVQYGEPGWGARVRELSRDGRGVDVVFENISDPELFGEALGTLRTYGRLVTCGAHGGGRVDVDVRRLYRNHLTIAGETGATPAMAREVFDLVARGELDPPPVFHTHPLEDVAEAQQEARGRDLFGRVVLTVAQP